MGVRDWIVPQDDEFFRLLEELADVVQKGAEHLVYTMEHYDDVRNKCHKMKTLEHKGDELTHKLYGLLNRTFITPLEPEEISRLASSLDDILDLIDSSTHMMYYYGLQETDAYMVEFSKLILMSTQEIAQAIRAIRDPKNADYIEERCIEINRLENLADDTLGHAIQDLFTTNDAIFIIKHKDIYKNLEDATDRCEYTANVLSDIAIRHS